MKRYITMVILVVFASSGSFLCGMGNNSFYNTSVKVSGEDSIVNAIQQYSNLTEGDETKWTFSWVPFVGSYVRGGTIEKINKFVNVCSTLIIANSWFNDENALLAWFPRHKPKAVCNALKNLEEQGVHALTLLVQMGVGNNDVLGLHKEIEGFLANIRWNKSLLATNCGQIKQKIKTKVQQKQREELTREEFNRAWWKAQALKWKMAKEIGTQVFNGTKWAIQTANQYSAPLLSIGAVWFAYNKLFGLPQGR